MCQVYKELPLSPPPCNYFHQLVWDWSVPGPTTNTLKGESAEESTTSLLQEPPSAMDKLLMEVARRWKTKEVLSLRWK